MYDGDAVLWCSECTGPSCACILHGLSAWSVNTCPLFFFGKTCVQKKILNQNYPRTMESDNTSTIFILWWVIINLLVIVLNQFQVEVEITCFGFQTFFMDVAFWLGFAEITCTCWFILPLRIRYNFLFCVWDKPKSTPWLLRRRSPHLKKITSQKLQQSRVFNLS